VDLADANPKGLCVNVQQKKLEDVRVLRQLLDLVRIVAKRQAVEIVNVNVSPIARNAAVPKGITVAGRIVPRRIPVGANVASRYIIFMQVKWS